MLFFLGKQSKVNYNFTNHITNLEHAFEENLFAIILPYTVIKYNQHTIFKPRKPVKLKWEWEKNVSQCFHHNNTTKSYQSSQYQNVCLLIGLKLI